MQPDGVLRPAGKEAFRDDRGGDDVLQAPGILQSGEIDVAELILVESLQLHLQNRGLDRIQPGIHADADVVVLELALAMDPIGLDERGPLVIVGENRTAVSVATHRLGGEEGGRGDVAERARALSVDAAAKSLRSILEDQETVFIGNGPDGLVVRRQAEKVHGNDHARTQPAIGKDLFHSAFQVRGVQVEGFLAHVCLFEKTRF